MAIGLTVLNIISVKASSAGDSGSSCGDDEDTSTRLYMFTAFVYTGAQMPFLVRLTRDGLARTQGLPLPSEMVGDHTQTERAPEDPGTVTSRAESPSPNKLQKSKLRQCSSLITLTVAVAATIALLIDNTEVEMDSDLLTLDGCVGEDGANTQYLFAAFTFLLTQTRRFSAAVHDCLLTNAGWRPALQTIAAFAVSVALAFHAVAWVFYREGGR